MSTQSTNNTPASHDNDSNDATPSGVTEHTLTTAAAPSKPTDIVADDLEDAALAYARMEPAALALRPEQLSAMNVDVVSAASTILGYAPRIVAYRDRAAEIRVYDVRNIDEVADRAKAAWYAAVTNMPEAAPKQFQAMLAEATTLRHHLFTSAEPLVLAQKFDRVAIDLIKQGSGHVDLASDVVALVALYRSKWDDVSADCGVTEAELTRGAALGSALFGAVSRRRNKIPSASEGALKVRRFWTLADQAYRQCQRIITFLEWDIIDPATVAPSLRRNSGVRKGGSAGGAAPANGAAPPTAAATAVDPHLVVGAAFGR